MPRSNQASLGAIALALGSLSLLCASDGADRVVTASAKAAREAAKALNRHETVKAVGAAEQAVSLAPREAAYRMLLGQSYLQAGRFRSAGEAFADTLQLDGGNGRAALNLALTQVALGDWRAARATLDAHANDIPGADRGLAMALAGDTTGAVALLTEIARTPGANAKVRQNLALAYALGGQWGVARMVAAADMSPADVDQRMQQWAIFAQPKTASDQVASLLGVRPVVDGGQPVALALDGPVPVPLAVAPVAVAPPAAVAPIQVAAATPVATTPKVTFAASREVVQPLPAAVIATPAAFKTPIKTAVAKPAARVAAAGGAWHVQLGAFDNAGVARDAWARATRRYAAFKGHLPQGMNFHTSKATFYRLSVGGFSRAGADQACRAYRARGGACFVRTGAGDQVAAWARLGGMQLAMR